MCCCAWQSQVFWIILLKKCARDKSFLNLLKSLVFNFFSIWSIMKVYIISCVLAQIHIFEKSGSWDSGINALGQSDYRIFKSTISLEQNDEKAWFLHVDTDSWKIEVDWKVLGWACQKWVWPLCSQKLLKLAVCQRKMNEINWFLVCWYKFMKAKSYFNNFLVVVIRNGCGLLCLQTLKSALLQEPIDEVSWFFVYWYKFRKAKSYYNIY